MSISKEQLMNKIAQDAAQDEMSKLHKIEEELSSRGTQGFFKGFWNDLTGKNMSQLKQYQKDLPAKINDTDVDALVKEREAHKQKNIDFNTRLNTVIESINKNPELKKFYDGGNAEEMARTAPREAEDFMDMVSDLKVKDEARQPYIDANRKLNDARDIHVMHKNLNDLVNSAREAMLAARIGTGAVATAGTIGTI